MYVPTNVISNILQYINKNLNIICSVCQKKDIRTYIWLSIYGGQIWYKKCIFMYTHSITNSYNESKDPSCVVILSAFRLMLYQYIYTNAGKALPSFGQSSKTF